MNWPRASQPVSRISNFRWGSKPAAKLLLVLGLASILAGCHPQPVDNAKPDVVFHVVTKQWAIIPDRIVVKQGQNVELIVTTPDVEHGLEIKGYGISAPVQPGEPAIIRFRATHSGSFEMRCDILCGRGHDRMKGRLIVVPVAADHAPRHG